MRMAEGPFDSTHGLKYPEKYLKRLSRELTEKFTGVFGEEIVERYVLESYTALMRTSAVTTDLVGFTIRFAGDRLTALAQATGAIDSPVPELLFVDRSNASRSQMVAALAIEMSGEGVQVRSAGITPAASLNHRAVRAMSEIGINIGTGFPKPLTDDVLQAADLVVTMDCRENVPVYEGKAYENWPVGDEDETIEQLRAYRQGVIPEVAAILRSLGVDAITLG